MDVISGCRSTLFDFGGLCLLAGFRLTLSCDGLVLQSCGGHVDAAASTDNKDAMLPARRQRLAHACSPQRKPLTFLN